MLEIHGLRAGYGDSVVLQDVSLHMPSGAVAALLGRNGMGKTTLCKALMGLIPTRGSIRFRNEEILGLPPHEIARRGIAYVPQGRGIFPHFTVEQNLQLGLAARGGRSVPPEVSGMFPQLQPMRRRAAGTLSGGEQQMLALARALVAAPTLLILDEPSEGLAPIIVSELAAVLPRLVADGKMTVLLVEQNLELVQRCASFAAFLENGAIRGAAAAGDLGPESEVIHRYLGL
jgi:ABC-type branched-subunit amino acid transport system ATPase component